MPFFKLNLNQRYFYFCAILLLSHCTGGKSPHPIDTDGALGFVAKTYYKTANLTTADVVLAKGSSQPAMLSHLESGTITSTVNIPPDQLTFSPDGKIVTILSQPGIFEYSPISLSDVVKGNASLPLPTIETYCTGVNPSGYAQIEVALSGPSYALLGVNGSQTTNIGGDGAVVKVPNTSSNPYVRYQKGQFGTLEINTSAPSAQDTAFYQADFQFTGQNPWPPLSSMYCHMNNVSVGNIHVVVFSTPGPPSTFTVPCGVTSLQIELLGGGGGGADADTGLNGDNSGGGGGGAYSKAQKTVTAGQVISYSVGGGGLGSTDGLLSGGNGVTSTCSTFSMVAGGGTGSPYGGGGMGGVASGGDLNAPGGNSDAARAGNGAPPLGGVGGADSFTLGCVPTAQSGTGPGAGGGGGCSVGGGRLAAGGDGANGVVVFTYSVQ